MTINQKRKKKTKIADTVLEISDNKPVNFQLNQFRGCRLGVENIRLPFEIFVPRKQEKSIFLRHLTDLTRSRIITPNYLAITIDV